MSHFIAMRQRRAEAWEKWRGVISEQRESGQRAAVFCRARGLSPRHFYAWKSRLRQAETAKFIEVEVRPGKASRAPSEAGAKAIEIRLQRGLSLFVAPGFEASHLRALLSELEG
jgi:hypothetical protein